MFGFKKNQDSEEKKGFFSAFRRGLAKTQNQFTQGLADLFSGKKGLDDDVLEELEMRLLQADVGVKTTQYIIDKIVEKSDKTEIKDYDAMMEALADIIVSILNSCEKPLTIEAYKPFVILMVGINGAGKTTTIGKLAFFLQQEGYKLILAAGDTFRAAAVEQLQTWGNRHQVPVVSQGSGADAASVIYDAYDSAKAKQIDVLLADTAGRLHTQGHLMKELEKIVRVIKKINTEAPHEILLVLDASIGQNALVQAREFHQVLGVTGLVITKLDGTAKGGVVLAIAQELALPIRYIGVGEKQEDLKLFDAQAFARGLLGIEDLETP